MAYENHPHTSGMYDPYYSGGTLLYNPNSHSYLVSLSSRKDAH